MRCAVVGHVEWVDFVPVERVPEAGEILTTNDHWAEPAGGGAVAAAELLRLGAETTFFTAVGEDELGRRAEEALRANGLRLEVAVRTAPQRRGAHVPGLPGRAHDHRARREAASARGRSARVGGAGRDRRRLLHRRRRGGATARRAEPASWSRPRGSSRLFAPPAFSSTRSSTARVIPPSGTSRATSIRRRGSSSRPRAPTVDGTSRTGRRVAGRPRRSLGRSRTPTAPATPSPPA